MKIVSLPDVLHEYLVHLIEAHAARGIHPEEGLAISRLWECVNNRVTTIPDAELQKAAEATRPAPTQKPECMDCYNEEGSYTCIRPAHETNRVRAEAGGSLPPDFPGDRNGNVID